MQSTDSLLFRQKLSGLKNFFPDEIWYKIFLFDPTRKDLFDKVIHQIKYSMVMAQFKSRSSVFIRFWGDQWYTNYFQQYGYAKNHGSLERGSLRNIIQEHCWNMVCNKILRPIQYSSRTKQQVHMAMSKQFYLY